MLICVSPDHGRRNVPSTIIHVRDPFVKPWEQKRRTERSPVRLLSVHYDPDGVVDIGLQVSTMVMPSSTTKSAIEGILPAELPLASS